MFTTFGLNIFKGFFLGQPLMSVKKALQQAVCKNIRHFPYGMVQMVRQQLGGIDTAFEHSAPSGVAVAYRYIILDRNFFCCLILFLNKTLQIISVI